ncbi:diphthine methyl ester synthase-like isoform X2 [Arctopsyche grandis]|uniref:diphthine methyl ester synthase-like isoform X2 n=1 Tax=Arctopsyche grandis TaxID=121162 RepID=UPI00406D8AF0
MLFLVGLGLGDARDITVRGLEAVKGCHKVYLEAYTSQLTVGHKALEEFYGREIIVADRELCESGTDELLNGSKDQDVALLVVGDPLGATTHTDILLRAKQKNIPYKVIQNASIINAVGCCGLQLYSFGETISIPFWTDNWKPDSFFDKILGNYTRGLHTLCLLDIKVKEPTEESLTKKVKVYMEPRFMSTSQACQQLIEIIQNRTENTDLTVDSLVVGLARVGAETQKIAACTMRQMCETDLGPPLHSLVIPARVLHPLEEEFLEQFKLDV